MIEKMQDSQIDEVMHIWLEATVKGHPFIEKAYWQANYEVVKTQYLPIGKTFIYKEEDKIQGFISIIEDSFIGALFVDVKAQGRGIGRALVEYCQSEYKTLELAAYVENKQAVEFYKKQGFEIVIEQENEDSKKLEYVMRWTTI